MSKVECGKLKVESGELNTQYFTPNTRLRDFRGCGRQGLNLGRFEMFQTLLCAAPSLFLSLHVTAQRVTWRYVR